MFCLFHCKAGNAVFWACYGLGQKFCVARNAGIDDKYIHFVTVVFSGCVYMKAVLFAYVFPVLALCLLAMHFWYGGEYGYVLVAAGLAGGLFAKKMWYRYAVSLFLYAGAFEWISTAVQIMQFRMMLGMEWLRAVAIIVSAAFFTFGSAVFLLVYLEKNANEILMRLKAVLFWVCFVLIVFIGSLAPVKMLLAERYFPLFGNVQAFLLAWYGVWIFEKLEDAKTHNAYRRKIWLIFSLVFFAQLGLGLLGLEKFLMSGKLHFPIPAFIYFTALYKGSFGFMLGLVLAAVFFTGSAWCSHLCYFGPFDSVAAFSGGKKSIRPLPGWLQKIVRYSRYAVFLFGGAAAVFLAYRQCSLAAVLFFSWAYIFVTFLVLLLSRKYAFMAHCSAFCPMGMLINALGRFSPWRLRISADCDSCGACEKICRYRAITAQSRASGRTCFHCSLCLDCMNVCRRRAISLHIAGLKINPHNARRVFLFFVVVIHILFLSFARV